MYKCTKCGRSVEWADYEDGDFYFAAYLLEEEELCGPCAVAQHKAYAANLAVRKAAQEKEQRAIAAAMAKLPAMACQFVYDEWRDGRGWHHQITGWRELAEPVTIDGFTFRPAWDDEMSRPTGGWELVPEVEPPDGSAFVGERYYRSK